eukprot:1032857-Alexandrium_andersonii.AAC.1
MDLIGNIDCYINDSLQWSDVWAGAPGPGPFQQHAVQKRTTPPTHSNNASDSKSDNNDDNDDNNDCTHDKHAN